MKKNIKFKFLKIIYLTAIFNFYNLENAFSAPTITIASPTTSCATECDTLTVAADGGTLVTTAGANNFPLALTDTFEGDANSLIIAKSNCTYVCETLKQRATAGLYLAESKASPTSNTFTRVMCNALRIVQGSAGKTFAAFAIIAVGIGFFSGKVSWGLMIGVAAGIAAMFGAPSIVAAISGQNTDMNCGTKL
jgi:type IV secretory pathway VirB2 component (pilin)